MLCAAHVPPLPKDRPLAPRAVELPQNRPRDTRISIRIAPIQKVAIVQIDRPLHRRLRVRASTPESSSPSTFAGSCASIRDAPSATAPRSTARRACAPLPSASACRASHARPCHVSQSSAAPSCPRMQSSHTSADSAQSSRSARATQSARPETHPPHSSARGCFFAAAFTASAIVSGPMCPKCRYGDSLLVPSISGRLRSRSYPASIFATKLFQPLHRSLASTLPRLYRRHRLRSKSRHPRVMSARTSSACKPRGLFHRTSARGFSYGRRNSGSIRINRGRITPALNCAFSSSFDGTTTSASTVQNGTRIFSANRTRQRSGIAHRILIAHHHRRAHVGEEPLVALIRRRAASQTPHPAPRNPPPHPAGPGS